MWSARSARTPSLFIFISPRSVSQRPVNSSRLWVFFVRGVLSCRRRLLVTLGVGDIRDPVPNSPAQLLQTQPRL